MQFDVFEKLSELETRVHQQKLDLQRKDVSIKHLTEQNTFLLSQLEANMREICTLKKRLSADVTDTVDQEVQTEWDVVIAERNVVDSAFAGAETSIADILKSTSDAVTNNTGYIFDEKTGLYFDKNSGYYYDPPRSGVYYTYNTETQEYSYHSSVSPELSEKFKVLLEKSSREADKELPRRNMPSPHRRSPTSSDHRRSSHRRHSRSASISSGTSSTYRRFHRRDSRHRDRRDRDRRYRRRSRSGSRSYSKRSYSRSRSRSSSSRRYRYRYRSRSRDRHHSSSSSSRHGSRHRHRDASQEKANGACIAATPVVYPPSVRLTVLGSGPRGPAVGSVGVLTSQDALRGLGCLGRDTNFCRHIFDLSQDPELEELHCEITFNTLDQTYLLRDKKSLSGTFINGTKMESGTKKVISHGDVLRIGANKLLVHIHPGRETCGQCDPSEIQAAMELKAASEAAALAEAEKQTPSPQTDATVDGNGDTSKAKEGWKKKPRRRVSHQRIEPSKYQDRAAMRRAREKAASANAKAIGSTNTGGSCASAGASVLTPIEETNVGARMLSKMGWNKGEGLGKEKGGIAEPIAASLRLDQRAGLGFSANAVPIDSTPSELRQARTLSVMQERYRQIEEKERQAQL